ncbi:diacylglycerol acyltransferase [Novymonas esmeraldas]|uniref:diacylglycerol O-acyltransferase n=1 Tax=Novymonas esmeraldas TaxID=1808958 RepID=A0AAW0EKD9_9TRYP
MDEEAQPQSRRAATPERRPSPSTTAAAADGGGARVTTRSLRKHVTSTISSSFHFLANEVALRGPGAHRSRSHSSASRASSGIDAPPLTRALPPATREEVEDQLDKVLYAIGQLQQLQQRGRYIASTEVKNLRRAFQFAVGVEQRYRDATAADGSRSTCSSASHTPSLRAQPAPTADAPTPVTDDLLETPTLSPPPSTREYSPKAAAADRLLAALEQYVDDTPTSTSFDVHGARFSWHSVVHTPGERRMQSLVVSLFIFFTGIPICLAITGLLLLWRYTAPLVVLYIAWIATFGRPRHPLTRQPRFTRFFLWRYYRDYFPIRLVVPKPVRRRFDKERNYFFVYHPHGIHTFGALVNFGLDMNDVSKTLEGITIHLQTLGINLFVPLWRQMAIWMGCGDASASCIRKTLRSGPGQSIMLVVGGAEESLMAKPNRNDLLLFKRKGFIKIALQEGTPLVPVYGFGENNVYGVSELAEEPWVRYLMELCKHYAGFAIPLVRGRGFFNFDYGILPHRRPIVVVVGAPLEVPQIPEPTAEDLDLWQGKYIECLRKLYNDHRGIYDLESTGLRIMQ